MHRHGNRTVLPGEHHNRVAFQSVLILSNPWPAAAHGTLMNSLAVPDAVASDHHQLRGA